MEAKLNTTVLDARTLLAPDDFSAVTDTVLDNNPGMPSATAEQIVVDALAFVATAAANPSEPLAPSRTVDEGWHALILHTALYRELCERLGRFVDHFPERPDATRQTPRALIRTAKVMRATGYEPNPGLWTLPAEGRIPVAAKCGHAPKCGVSDPSVVIA